MTMPTTLTEDRLRQLLDSYGADAGRWPDAERPAALALLAERPDLEGERREAARLDALLATAERPAASGALLGRLLETAPQGAGRGRGWLSLLWPFGPAWQPAFGLAVALLLGVASGPLLPEADATQTAQQETTEEIAVLLATPLYAEESL